jgi:V/A-type H+-transporting ATPase subunit I
MPLRESMEPVRMDRVAVVAPTHQLRRVLVELADEGAVQLDRRSTGTQESDLVRRLQRFTGSGSSSQQPTLSPTPPDVDQLEDEGRASLLAGEAEVQRYLEQALSRGPVSGLAGWAPAIAITRINERLAPVGGALVPLERPHGVDPPTLLHESGGMHKTFSPLVSTYTTVPYTDVDPTLLAGFAYVLMFGMMFGDVGHGLLLAAGGLLLRAGRVRWLRQLERAWVFVVAAGVSSMFFGALFGEFFGPTGVIPVLWIEPLQEPIVLLGAALGVGAILLSAAYALGTWNRWREGGWRLALVAPSGLAGVALFSSMGIVALAVAGADALLIWVGILIAVSGAVLAYIGLFAAAGGGAAGAAQAAIELFDVVLRVGTSLVSFARLAAFGLAHAALGSMVWLGTTALWSIGFLGALAGVVVFVLGNALAFTLQAIVAGVQALRLEYYELFSRVFTAQGEPFEPWHVPTVDDDDSARAAGARHDEAVRERPHPEESVT